jgi:hypothetical protein
MAVLPAQRYNRNHRTRFRRLARMQSHRANLNPNNPTKRSLRSPAVEGFPHGARRTKRKGGNAIRSELLLHFSDHGAVKLLEALMSLFR